MTLTKRKLNTPEPNTLEETRYEVTAVESGRIYAVTKQYYAAGASLFTWVVTGYPEGIAWGENEMLEANTLKGLLSLIEAVETREARTY